MLPILATCCRQKLPSSRDLVLVGLAGGWAEVSSPRRGLDRGLLGEADGVLRRLSRRGHAGGTGGTGGSRAQRAGRVGWRPFHVPGLRLPAVGSTSPLGSTPRTSQDKGARWLP